MTRRTFLANLVPPARTPNVVYIMADDLGCFDLGCYGQTLIQTPEIDRLARQGMRFTQAYAGASVCAPSRCCLMTGMHGGHATVRANHSKRTKGRVPLNADDVTVAEVLKRAGYRTAAIGKWGLGEPDTTGLPNRQGFDEWFGYLNQDHAADHYTDYLWRNERKQTLEANRNGGQREYTHDLFTREALGFLDRQTAANPFFLYLSYTVPHAELVVPDLGIYRDKPWTLQQKTYAAMISRLDADVGRVIAKLADRGLDRDTIVFFTSDNGATFPGGIELFRSTGSLRDKKGTLYEGGIRVPMLVRWPGHVAPGATNDTPWAFYDFLPTIADVCGARAPANLDGVSIKPALEGKAMPERALYWESHEKGFRQAVRRGRWKAVRHGLRGKIELYDLAADSGESTDAAASHPREAAEFERIMAESRTENPEYPAVT